MDILCSQVEKLLEILGNDLRVLDVVNEALIPTIPDAWEVKESLFLQYNQCIPCTNGDHGLVELVHVSVLQIFVVSGVGNEHRFDSLCFLRRSLSAGRHHWQKIHIPAFCPLL